MSCEPAARTFPNSDGAIGRGVLVWPPDSTSARIRSATVRATGLVPGCSCHVLARDQSGGATPGRNRVPNRPTTSIAAPAHPWHAAWDRESRNHDSTIKDSAIRGLAIEDQ